MNQVKSSQIHTYT